MLCRLFGHRWVPCEIRYEQARAMAFIGDASEPVEVPVTWVTDEVCARCGGESRWPT